MDHQWDSLGSISGNRYGLTRGQMRALMLVAAGLNRKKIAEHMGVSIHTVNSHLEKIFEKLHVHSAAAAVAKALTEGIVPYTPSKGS